MNSSFLFMILNFCVLLSFSLTKSLLSIVWIALTFLTNLLHADFLSTSFFSILISLLKSIGVVSNLWIWFNKYMILSSLNQPFQQIWMDQHFLNQILLHNYTNLIQLLFRGYMVLENNYFFIMISFLSIQLLNELSYRFYFTQFNTSFPLLLFQFWILCDSFCAILCQKKIPKISSPLGFSTRYVNGTVFLTFLITKNYLYWFWAYPFAKMFLYWIFLQGRQPQI